MLSVGKSKFGFKSGSRISKRARTNGGPKDQCSREQFCELNFKEKAKVEDN